MPQPEQIEEITQLQRQLEEAPVQFVAGLPRLQCLARVSKFTIARLFNTGNYEHFRVEIEVSVPEGASAAEAFIAAERVLASLRPKCPVDMSNLQELRRQSKWTDHDWEQSWQKGSNTAEQARALSALALGKLEQKYSEWKAHQEKTRKLLDDLGAAYYYKDAKLDWDDEPEM